MVETYKQYFFTPNDVLFVISTDIACYDSKHCWLNTKKFCYSVSICYSRVIVTIVMKSTKLFDQIQIILIRCS